MPTSGIAAGRPLAYVVVLPVLGSIRRTRPPGPSVTYSALSGPIALPEPQPPTQPGAAKVASVRTAGLRASAAAGMATVATTSKVISLVSVALTAVPPGPR
jgi:hypothetical protein